jgi:diguanylate cyclase (GGDEF)-like protein/PAS domain S-box-containing protein
MDFDAAINAHLEWKARLTEYLRAPDRSLSESEIGRDDLCDLGRWLHDDPPVDDSTLRVLIDRHALFHRAVAAVVARAHDGDRVDDELVEGALTDVGVASGSLIATLRAAAGNPGPADSWAGMPGTSALDWSSASWAKAIFAESPLGMSITESRTRRILSVNERYVEITGRTRAELIGADWQTFTHPDDLSVGDALGPDPSTWHMSRVPQRYVTHDGRVVWVEMTITPLGSDASGQPLHLCTVDDVTDRRQSEIRTQRLVDILESSPDYIATTDLNGTIKWANRATLALAGASTTDDLEHGDVSLFPLMSSTSRRRFFDEALPALWSHGAWVGEIEGVLPDRSTFPLSFVAIAHPGPDGYPEYFSGVGRDITATKLAEAALEASETRMRTLVESAPIGIFQTSAFGACTYVNPAFCTSIGLDNPDDALGFGWGKVLHPDDALAVGSQWATAIRTDQPFIGQFRFLTPAGEVVWADIEAVPIHDPDGTTTMFLGTVDDITERLALERAQFEASELFRTAFDDAPTGILLTDVSTTVPIVIRSNQAYADMLGYGTDELAGIHLADLTHPDDFPDALDARSKLMAGEISRHHMELRYRHADGHWIWVSLTRSVVRDQHGQARYLIAQTMDISAQVAARQRAEQLASTDALTGLPNRRTFEARLTDAIDIPDPPHRVSLIFIDLDRFKTINDRLGHDTGDALLRNVATVLTDTMRATDCIARLGGDEFAIVMPGIDPLELPLIAERLHARLNFPHHTDDGDITVTASIGIATHRPGESIDDFLRRSDQLMYDAKRSGRDAIRTDN